MQLDYGGNLMYWADW